MTPLELVRYLDRAGFTLSIKDGRLDVAADPAVLSYFDEDGLGELREALNEHSAAIARIVQDRERIAEKAKRTASDERFSSLSAMAKESDCILVQCSPVHFQLFGPCGEWLINLYPTTGKVYCDPKRKPVELNLVKDWTLAEAVRAATRLTEK